MRLLLPPTPHSPFFCLNHSQEKGKRESESGHGNAMLVQIFTAFEGFYASLRVVFVAVAVVWIGVVSQVFI